MFFFQSLKNLKLYINFILFIFKLNYRQFETKKWDRDINGMIHACTHGDKNIV
jgi:hypothetical protein